MKRFKPDPLPQIIAVPEHRATGDLKAVYERTKTDLGVPWMGVVTMAFAQFPHFFAALWSAMAPVVATEEFAQACAALREAAEHDASKLAPPDIVMRLREAGYSDREIDEIRACNEVFSAGNMPYVLLATRARLLLEDHPWPERPGSPRRTLPKRHPKPALLETHHGLEDLEALYQDIRETLGLPFVNTDYRAFARWPSYFCLAWRDLRGQIATDAYGTAVTRLHERAVDLASNLPNPTGFCPEDLHAAMAKESDPDRVLSTVQLFQWLLPGLALNVAFFRAQLAP